MKQIDANKHQHKFMSGFARCMRCQIKENYFYEALGTLEGWPEKEKGTDWEDRVLGLMTCPAIGAQGWKGPDRTIAFLR